MTEKEQGFLLLNSSLGDPERHPLTRAQFRLLTQRARQMALPSDAGELELHHLLELGLGKEFSLRILALLEDKEKMRNYTRRAEKNECVAVTRVSETYPLLYAYRLGENATGAFWAKGDLNLLNLPAIGLVGSRDLNPENRKFAERVGEEAAMRGLVLISGNARGADTAAQEACLNAGGSVISVIADRLDEKESRERMLYLSEEDYDVPFSAQRALQRNNVIHSMGLMTFVAQCTFGKGGTWDGTMRNLRSGYSPVFCFRDGSEAMTELEQMGANLISMDSLGALETLSASQLRMEDLI